MGIPVVCYGPVDDFFNQVWEVSGIIHFKTFCQREGNCQLMFFPELEQVGIPGVFTAACVRYIKYIFQFRIISGSVNEGYACIFTPDIAAHLLVPGIIVSAGGGIRALGIDHELFMVGVFVQPSHGSQKCCPVLVAACDLDGGLVC